MCLSLCVPFLSLPLLHLSVHVWIYIYIHIDMYISVFVHCYSGLHLVCLSAVVYLSICLSRALMRFGSDLPGKFDLSSLRILGSVGEPINPEAWRWYFSVIGQNRCTIVDTYWQTETGGHVLTPIPGATVTKPGSACFPFLGIEPAVLDPHTGEEKKGNNVCGVLCLKRPWPGILGCTYTYTCRSHVACTSVRVPSVLRTGQRKPCSCTKILFCLSSHLDSLLLYAFPAFLSFQGVSLQSFPLDDLWGVLSSLLLSLCRSAYRVFFFLVFSVFLPRVFLLSVLASVGIFPHLSLSCLFACLLERLSVLGSQGWRGQSTEVT